MEHPLAGLRVVDTTNNCGELCGRLLSDLGADVVLIEPPQGSTLRQAAPFSPNKSTAKNIVGFPPGTTMILLGLTEV